MWVSHNFYVCKLYLLTKKIILEAEIIYNVQRNFIITHIHCNGTKMIMELGYYFIELSTMINS